MRDALHTDYDGYRVMVFRDGVSFRAAITPPWADTPMRGTREHATQDEAMLSAIRGIAGIRAREPEGWCEQRAKRTVLQQWVDHCEALAAEPADLYAGSRKILRGRTLALHGFHAHQDVDKSLQLEHCGYTGAKLRQLERRYLHKRSLAVAEKMWLGLTERRKFGTVTFHCFN
jgi:hypothetical protein